MLKTTTSWGLILLLALTSFAHRFQFDPLTEKERNVLINDLQETKKVFLASVKGLSEAQLNYKFSAEAWSVKECAYHLALSENNLRQWADGAIKEPANSDKRKEIKTTDEALLQMVRDRSHKVKTSETFEPAKAKYENLDQALADFTTKRDALVAHIQTTRDDFRNHVVQGPFGFIDAYQVLLLLSAHTTRHTKQIEEVKA
ncbi:MAG: DinB family protein, partial [Bacteroidota bacterium]